jgi:glycosyltransferase involved in cell wall biosynthesis
VKKNYKLSIVVPFVQIDSAFKQTVNSVFEQIEISNIELILVAKSLRDVKPSYIKFLASRFNVKFLENNKGIYQAINCGIQECSGDYILVFGCGDGFLNQNCSKKISEFFIYNPDYIYFNVLLRDESSNPVASTVVGVVDTIEKVKKIHHQGVVISKKCYEQHGLYDISFKTSADFDYLIKIYSINSMYLDQVMTFFNLGGESSPSICKFLRQRREIVKIHEKHSISLSSYSKINFFIKAFLFSFSPKLRNRLIALRRRIKG